MKEFYVSNFIQNAVNVSEVCANGRDLKASYEILYFTDSGTLITTCVVDGTECSDGMCRYELQNYTADSICQPPLSQFSGEDMIVSMSARNIVGRSTPTVSRSISEFIEGYFGYLTVSTKISDLAS